MDDDDDVHDQVGDAQHVGVVGPGFGPLKELQHPETSVSMLAAPAGPPRSACCSSDSPRARTQDGLFPNLQNWTFTSASAEGDCC